MIFSIGGGACLYFVVRYMGSRAVMIDLGGWAVAGFIYGWWRVWRRTGTPERSLQDYIQSNGSFSGADRAFGRRQIWRSGWNA